MRLLQGLPEGLAARLHAYAERKGLTDTRALSALLDAGLRAHERAVAAGKVRGASVTSEQAKAAISARWATRRQQTPAP